MNIFEVGISRHAPKHDQPDAEGYNVAHQEVDAEIAQQEVGPVVEEMLGRFTAAPEGAILAIQPSNIIRAKQTRELLLRKISDSLDNNNQLELVEFSDDQEAGKQLLEYMRGESRKKFIIADIRDTQLLGFKEDGQGVAAANKWKRRFSGDENLIGKLRAMHSTEANVLLEQIQEAGFSVDPNELKPQEFGSTPEEDALRQINWMRAMKQIGERYFPDRPLYLEGISHNIRADFTSLALLDENISVESIDRVLGGKFRKPFERSSVIFDGDGVTVGFKDMKKEYSVEQFEALIRRLVEKSKARRHEWEDTA